MKSAFGILGIFMTNLFLANPALSCAPTYGTTKTTAALSNGLTVVLINKNLDELDSKTKEIILRTDHRVESISLKLSTKEGLTITKSFSNTQVAHIGGWALGSKDILSILVDGKEVGLFFVPWMKTNGPYEKCLAPRLTTREEVDFPHNKYAACLKFTGGIEDCKKRVGAIYSCFVEYAEFIGGRGSDPALIATENGISQAFMGCQESEGK